jgi:hypothetical protein
VHQKRAGSARRIEDPERRELFGRARWQDMSVSDALPGMSLSASSGSVGMAVCRASRTTCSTNDGGV